MITECDYCEVSFDVEKQSISLAIVNTNTKIGTIKFFCSMICHALFTIENMHDNLSVQKTLDETWFPVIRQLRDQIVKTITWR